MSHKIAKQLRQLARMVGDEVDKSEIRRAVLDIKRQRAAQLHEPNPLPTRRRTAQDKAARYPFKTYHPLRQLDEIFRTLSDRGRERALQLKFGPKRTHGSPTSLRMYPRGLPGTGWCSMMTAREIEAEIDEIRKYAGVKQYG